MCPEFGHFECRTALGVVVSLARAKLGEQFDTNLEARVRNAPEPVIDALVAVIATDDRAELLTMLERLPAES